MSAVTEEKTTEEKTTKIIPLADLTSEKLSDGSYIADPKGAVAAFETYLGELPKWVVADATAKGATAVAARQELEMRTHCILPSGAIDIAGNSFAWKLLYADRITGAAVAAGNALADVKRFQGAVRVYRTNTGMTHGFVAEYVTKTTNNLATKTVGKGDEKRTVADIVAEKTKGTEIPLDVRKAADKIYAAQIVQSEGPTKGNRLAGFETFPESFGPRKVGGSKVGNTGKETPSKSWTKLREDFARLAPKDSAEQIRLLLTAYGDSLVGPPQSKGRDSIAEKGATAGLLADAAEYLKVLADNLKGTSGATKEKVNEKRYTV